jgi:predicted phosphodiesterase
VLFVNPGSASQGRGGHARSVALLSWPDGAKFATVDFITLGR